MKFRYYLLSFLVFTGICSAQAQRSLWGVTSAGVADNKGVIFKTNEDGTGFSVQYNFVTDFPGASPQNALTLANGKFYGLTSTGGANDQGLLFEYDPVNNTYSKKFDFSPANGTYPYGGLVLASNGLLYGMTTSGGAFSRGVLFEYDPVGGSFLNRFDFSATNGADPQGNLIQASTNGKLYGMTPNGGANNEGVLFEYDPVTFAFQKKIDFLSTTNGSNPKGDLVEAPNLKLYGMTSGGGTNSVGVLFEYNPIGNVFTKKVNFSAASSGANPNGSLMVAGNGKLYGLTSNGGSGNSGTLFDYVAGTTFVNKNFDFTSTFGTNPQGSLVQAGNGFLYGTGFNGGATNEGTIFEYDPTLNTLTKKFDFAYGVSGGNPLSNLTLAPNGRFYGMTPYGGVVGYGVLFEYDPTTSGFSKKLDFFSSSKGSNPLGGLVQAPNGMLYGMTSNGGSNSAGVLFEYDPIGSSYLKKVDFSTVATGGYPSGRLLLAANNKLYGLTPYGGSSGDGVLFEYDPGSLTVTKKVDFSSFTSGAVPQGSLQMAANGKLYGMTSQGGTNSNGTLFEFDPATGIVVVKYSFPSIGAGINPKGSLMQAANGKLYGMTNQGGANLYGVIFEYVVATNTYTKKIDFSGTNGSYPYGDLTQASNGKLFGMTSGGGANSAGVIFEYDQVLNAATVKYDFISASTGSNPQGSLTEVAIGKLFGLTSTGGTLNSGVLFEYDISSSLVGPLQNFGGANGASPQFESLLLVPGKQAQTITFNSLPNKSFGDAPFPLSAISDSGLPITYSSSDLTKVTISGNTVTIIDFGTVTITASQTGDANYSFAQNVDQPLVITRASQTITFGPLAPKIFGDLPFTISATASSGLTVTFASSDPTIATITLVNTVTIQKAGTVTITASQAGNASYDVAPNVPQTLVINKNNQTISFAPPATKTFGDPPFPLVATATSSLTVAFSSSDTGIASISGGNMVTILQAGVVIITASQAGNGNYNAAIDVLRPLSINLASQTITFGPLATKIFGDAPFALTGTTTSGLPLTYVSSDPLVASISGTTVTILKVGSVTVFASQPGNVNYNAAASVPPQTLTINKANQTITFSALPSKATIDPPFNLAATTSSGLVIAYVSSNPSVASVIGNTVTIGVVGSTTITASQLGDVNYNAATPVPQLLTVNLKLSQTITFAPLPAKKFGDISFSLNATASSSLPISFASSNTAVATIIGNLVSIVGVGTTTITASQSGDASYNPATSVNQDLVVNKGDQTITFAPLAAKTVGGAPFSLGATASSGLSVSYTSSNTNVATISANSVTIVGLGTTTITANQNGNVTYNPAPPVPQNLAILITGDLPDPSGAVAIYPNPTKDKLFVNLTDFVVSPVTLRITDMTGRNVHQQNATGGDIVEISVADHPVGMYVLFVSQGSKTLTAKYIKN